MAVSCFVKNCKLKQKVKHRPKTAEQLQDWKNVVGYSGNVSVLNNFRLCDNHFSEHQCERDFMYELTGRKQKRRLLPTAVPDLLLGGCPSPSSTTGTLATNIIPPVNFSKVTEDGLNVIFST